MGISTLDRVKKVTAEELGAKEEEIASESSFSEDLGADFLDVVGLVMALEDEFQVEIPDDDVAGLPTVGEVVAYLDRKLAAK